MNNRKIYLQDSSAKVKRKGKSSRNDNEQAPLINQGRLFCFLSLLFTVMTLLKKFLQLPDLFNFVSFSQHVENGKIKGIEVSFSWHPSHTLQTGI